MLTSLTVKHFAIVDHLQMDWHAGMTTITGETGAGKSIAIDALGLCLGARAEASNVRPGEEKAEINACFSLEALPHVRHFLAEQDLDQGDECLLRRIVSKEGRSRGYINGTQVPIQQLKQLGDLLLNIHGQHAHQLLLKDEQQRGLLDAFASHQHLQDELQTSYAGWRTLKQELKQLEAGIAQRDARKQLLEYQVKELDEFGPEPGEFEQVDQEHKALANGQTLMDEAQHALSGLYENDEQNAYAVVQQIATRLAGLESIDKRLSDFAASLFDASAMLADTSSELRRYLDGLDMDPAKLAFLEERLQGYISLSRKHNVAADALCEHHTALADELCSLNQSDDRLDALSEEIDQALEIYKAAAHKLHLSRRAAADELCPQIQSRMRLLNMPHGEFAISLDFDPDATPNLQGLDKVEFLVTTNPGQPMAPLARVASGGELSRISLSIQVITAQKVTTPTLIFDEVDVGISGPTASTVGKLLRELGEATQVICVTHLPQVAACGHQQLFVCKESINGQTHTGMSQLNLDGRVDEIARLLGGDKITKLSRANAKELLQEQTAEL